MSLVTLDVMVDAASRRCGSLICRIGRLSPRLVFDIRQSGEERSPSERDLDSARGEVVFSLGWVAASEDEAS